jgi:ADP-ribosyl-[dinitrogen reductase] hydrolase
MAKETGFLSLRGCDDRQVGGIVGLLVGDALGVNFEFKSPDEIPPRHLIEMQPPVGFRKSHPHVPPCTWSDDGAQALVLLDSLLQHGGRLSLTDFANRLLRLADEGYMALDGDVFDIGYTTECAFHRLHEGVSPHESGGTDEYDCGNGSLMRVLPLALLHAGPDEELVRDAHLQSLIRGATQMRGLRPSTTDGPINRNEMRFWPNWTC